MGNGKPDIALSGITSKEMGARYIGAARFRKGRLAYSPAPRSSMKPSDLGSILYLGKKHKNQNC